MRPIIIALLTGALIILLAHSGFFYTWNLKLTDGLYGGKTPLTNIKIIAIDDKSLQEIGRWPWQRTEYIKLIQQLEQAKVITFDIAFFEPTPEDKQLAEEIRKHDNIILAREYDYTRQTELTPAQDFEGIETGIVNIYADKDGISRSVPAQVNEQPSLALKTAEKYLGRKPETPQKIIVNYVGEPNTYKIYPATDIINSRIPKEEFNNAIVLIGATAPDLHDDYIVPTSSGKRMPGVEIHAHTIQTIITKQYLNYQTPKSLYLTILLMSLLVGILFSTKKIWWTAGTLTIIIFAYFVIAIFAFEKGHILNLIYVPATLIATSLTTIGYIATSEAWHKRKVLTLFGRYVSKDIVDHLLKNEKAADLGGEEREITAMFADIRGFTAMSEKMTPHEVINVLNHYFGDMTDLVFKHGGTLDKYIGDCLFAVWGSPLPDKNHAQKAVQCAIEIQKRLLEQHTKEFPPIALGIGICSGPAVIGNMGSKQRQEFTAIGDTINIASRLSGYAEKGEIKITKTTYDLIKHQYKCKELEPLKVKGKEKPLTVYLVKELNP